MAREPEDAPAAAGKDADHASGSLTAEQRARLRAQSAAARASAQAAAARCEALKRQFEARVSEQAQWRETLTRVLPELRETVGRYARCLKEEGEAPQRMLVLVKEAVHEVLPASSLDVSGVLDLAIGFAIEAYYDAA